jgi:CSLREA domain-containing protein
MLEPTTHGARLGGGMARAIGAGSALALALCVLGTPVASAAGPRPSTAPSAELSRVVQRPGPMQPAPALSVANGAGAGSRRGPSPMRSAPRATGAAATFTVTSTSDSPLASPTGKRCVDAQASHPCSLRAAVQAANNLDRPVLIKLAAKTYKLTDAALGRLTVTNAGGTSIVGVGSGSTKIQVPAGDIYGVLYLNDGANAAGATLYLTGLAVSGGIATDGAGLQMASEPNLSAVLDRVVISGNHAVTSGGGVYVEYGSLWVTASSISGNTAGSYGGGIYNYWGNVYLTGDLLNANLAVGNGGGGIFQEYGSTHVIGGSVSYDVAGTNLQSANGGGIFDENGAVYLSDGVVVSHDTALNDGDGGGAYEYDGTLVASGATFSYDRAIGGADASGGGLFVEFSAHITLDAVAMSHNTTSATNDSYGGGAIFDHGYEFANTLSIGQGSSFTDNGSSAVFIWMENGGVTATITDTLFTGNVSSLPNSGAAVRLYGYQDGGINLTMLHDRILNNTDLGTFAAGGVEAYASFGASVDMRFDGDTVSGNVSKGIRGTGGIQAYSVQNSSSPVEIDNSVLRGNQATNAGSGGAVYDASNDNFDNSTLTLTNDVLSHNVVGSPTLGQQGTGGAVASYDFAALSMTGCTVVDNTANGTAAGGGIGGGVYDASYLGTSFISDVVSGNRATGHNSEGGGIYTYPFNGGGQLVRSTLSSNYADFGAGLYVYEYTFGIDRSTIARNIAGGGGVGGEGGGVYEYSSTLNVENSTIADNLAQSAGAQHGAGGGIYAYSGSAITLYFVTISGNASLLGAGLYSAQAAGTLRDSIVADNHTTLGGKTQADCYAAGRFEVFDSSGGNVLSRANCVLALSFGDTLTARPGLLALASNGGPTKTMALTATSPAAKAAHGDCPLTDQRGVARPKSGTCDAGAYQRAVKKK